MVTGHASVGLDLVGGAVATVGVAMGVLLLLDLPVHYPAAALLLYAALSGLILLRLPERTGGAGLGAANRVTLARAALVLPMTALLAAPAAPGPGGSWAVAALGGVALALDGADGWTARRTGSSTPFGARFDMELDAFTLLVLALFVWQTGQAGPWVILIGGLRYLFLLAGRAWPWLGAPLPESFRRKTACVVQGVVLVVAVAPVVPSALASAVCAVALALLVYSFAADVLWLAERRPKESEAGA